MSDNDFEKGEEVVKIHTKSQCKSRKEVTFMVMQCLYVGDGSFPFKSGDQLKRGLQVIHDHFSCFVLNMHIGKSIEGNIKASKTKCVFFSLPQFF